MKFFKLLFVLFFIFHTTDSFTFRSLSNTKCVSFERTFVYKHGLCSLLGKNTLHRKVLLKNSMKIGLSCTGKFTAYLLISPIFLVGCIPIQLIIFFFQTIGMIMFDNDE